MKRLLGLMVATLVVVCDFAIAGDRCRAGTAERIHAALFPPESVAGMRVKLDGCELKVEKARCSAMPVNIRWPGHQRDLDQTEICTFVRFDFTKALSLAVTPGRPFTNVVVRPLAKKVAFRREGDSVRIDLRKGWAVTNVKRYDAIRLRFCDDAEIIGITIRDSQLYAVGRRVV